jgi:hypothetical protein
VSKQVVKRQKYSQSASEITELGLEGVVGTCKLECVDRWGSLLGLGVPEDATVGKEPDWCRESPVIVDFFIVV